MQLVEPMPGDRHRSGPSGCRSAGGRLRRWRAAAGIGLGSWLSLGASQAWPDVPADHWARAGVTAMAARGLLAGRPDGRFDGSCRLTRYELAALVARVLPLRPMSLSGRPPLLVSWQDLPEHHWARPSLVWLTGGLGLLREWPGLAIGYFSGDRPASRFELAVALAPLLPPQDEAGTVAGTPAWAVPSLRRTQAHGVLTGFPDGQFHGERAVTRYEAALAFHKALAVPWTDPPGDTPDTADPAPAPVASALPTEPAVDGPTAPALGLTVPPAPTQANLPRLAVSFLPEYLSEMTDPTRGEATGWAMASTGLQADWAEGPLTVSGLWRIAQYGLRQSGGALQARLDQQMTASVGYRWQFGKGRHDGEISLLGLGTYWGRRASGTADDLLGMDLQAFGIGMGVQLRWPVAYRLVASARGEYLPVLGAQFGPAAGVSGQLGLVQAAIGLDWYLDRLSLGLGYRLRHLYDGQQHFSQWANGLQLKAALAF
jgi:hypothetical protein